jgi:preprotein translocase subunit SecG
MYVFITVLIVIASLILILLVVIQNSKGGGLAAGFSSSNQVMGVRKTTDFLEKATWGFTIAVVALTVVSSFFIPQAGVKDSLIRDEIQNTIPAADPNAVSPFGTPTEDDAAPVEETPETPAE